MKIVTNNKPRRIKSFFELSEKFQKELFSQYQHAFSDSICCVQLFLDECMYVVYRNQAYNLFDMIKSPIPEFDVIENETFFSGVGFKFVDDDHVKCFSYYS